MSFTERFSPGEKYRDCEKGFIPINRINSPVVRIDVPLPQFVDTGQIGVDLRRVHALCWLGGLRHLRVEKAGGREDEETTPMVVGVAGDGGAYAGGAVVKKAKPFHFDDYELGSPASELNFLSVPHATVWADGKIQLDLEAMSKRIIEDKRYKGNARSSEAWARLLNKALKEGIANIGINHLLYGVRKTEMLYLLFLTLMGPRLLTSPSPSRLFSSWLLSNFIGLGLSFMASLQNQEDGYRLSAFYGPQLDRAIALKLFLQAGPLVKTIPKAEQ